MEITFKINRKGLGKFLENVGLLKPLTIKIKAVVISKIDPPEGRSITVLHTSLKIEEVVQHSGFMELKFEKTGQSEEV